MSATLSLRNIRIPGIIDDFSCDLQPGDSALICTAREDTGVELSRLVAGASRPESGTARVNGMDPTALGQEELYLLRREIGIVPSGGGLISNLKLWENITLPLLYHTGGISPDDEQDAVEYLANLGYSGATHALPGHLSSNEKRLAAMVRSFLMRPKIMIYCNCFENVSSETHQTFFRVAKRFHEALADRISLFIGPTPEPSVDLAVDMILRMDG
jgi:phospholipid/cholesterol/gamma-HCH transport system ATP-binding protein